MYDVVVLGGSSHAVRIATKLASANLKIALITESPKVPQHAEHFDTLFGRAYVAGADTVALLDPATGDEQRMLQTHAIVVAKQDSRMLGLAKLGIERDQHGAIRADENGKTLCPTVFAIRDSDDSSIDRVTTAILALLASGTTAASNA
jgi:thioredoxin reductase